MNIYSIVIMVYINMILVLGYSTNNGGSIISKYHSRYGNSSALKITSLKTTSSKQSSSLFVLSSSKIQPPPPSSSSSSVIPSKLKIIIPVVIALISVFTLGIRHYYDYHDYHYHYHHYHYHR